MAEVINHDLTEAFPFPELLRVFAEQAATNVLTADTTRSLLERVISESPDPTIASYCRVGNLRCLLNLSISSGDDQAAIRCALEALDSMQENSRAGVLWQRFASVFFEVVLMHSADWSWAPDLWNVAVREAKIIATVPKVVSEIHEVRLVANAAALLLAEIERHGEPNLVDDAWALASFGINQAEVGGTEWKYLRRLGAMILLHQSASREKPDTDTAIGLLEGWAGSNSCLEDAEALLTLSHAWWVRHTEHGQLSSLLEAMALFEVVDLSLLHEPDLAFASSLRTRLDQRLQGFSGASVELSADPERSSSEIQVGPVGPDLDRLVYEMHIATGRSDFAGLRNVSERIETLVAEVGGEAALSDAEAFLVALLRGGCAYELSFDREDDGQQSVAIGYRREALSIALESDEISEDALGMAENNLGNALMNRSWRLGEVEDAKEAVELLRSSLERARVGTGAWAFRASNLADALINRYELVSAAADLGAAIDLDSAISSIAHGSNTQIVIAQIAAGMRALTLRQSRSVPLAEPHRRAVAMMELIAESLAPMLEPGSGLDLHWRLQLVELLIGTAIEDGDISGSLGHYATLIGLIRQAAQLQRGTRDRATLLRRFEHISTDAFCMACRAGEPGLAVEVLARAQSVMLSLAREPDVDCGTRRDPEEIRSAIACAAFVGADERSGFAVIGGCKDPWSIVELPRLTATEATRQVARLENARTEFRNTIGLLEVDGPQYATQLLTKWGDALDKTLDWLGLTLGAPLLQSLGGHDSLTVFSTGPIRQLPLHASRIIRNGLSSYLLEHCELSYGMGIASRGDTPLASEEDGSVLLLMPCGGSSSYLKARDAEANAIRATCPDLVEVVGDMDHEGLISRLLGPSHLHFAGHSCHDEDDPLASFLDLGSDKLTAAEVAGLPLTARTAVLSSCSSAAIEGRLVNEALGLTAALLFAGCDVVVGAQWLAWDRAAADVMERLYESWNHQAESLSGALRHAQLTFAKGNCATDFADIGRTVGMLGATHPLFWASFRASVWVRPDRGYTSIPT
jgi:hypothetical protein